VKQISDGGILQFLGKLGFAPCDSWLGRCQAGQALISRVDHFCPLGEFRSDHSSICTMGHLVPCQDAVCFGAAISACETAAEWQHALNLLQQLLQAELLPNTVIFNALASACEA